MRTLSLPDLDAVYELSNCEIIRHRVDHLQFEAFSGRLRALMEALGEDAREASWRSLLRDLRKYRLLCSACPLPFSSRFMASGDLITSLRRTLASCRRLWTGVTPYLEGLLAAVELLQPDASNPLLELAAPLVANAITPAFLVRESSYSGAVSALVASALAPHSCPVVTASQLRGSECYDVLVVFGPTYLYPDYVFTAPRAARIECVRYAWQRDGQIPAQAFSGGLLSKSAAAVRVVEAPESKAGLARVDDGDLLPQVSWSDVVTGLSQHPSLEEEADNVHAKGLLLEGGLAVLLECSEGSRTLVIDLDSQDGRQVLRIPTQDIEPGMFVLLRTSGGGDYIKPLADLILSGQAGSLRAMQADWKARLRATIAAEDIDNVVGTLRRAGSRLANPANLRNWLSSRSIHPANFEDFAAIMAVIGAGARAKEYWQAMCMIDRAHRKAGFRIRKMLLARVRQADLSDFEQSGRVDFELADADGGRITAFRVTDISADEYQVDSSLIGRPFDREEVTWLA